MRRVTPGSPGWVVSYQSRRPAFFLEGIIDMANDRNEFPKPVLDAQGRPTPHGPRDAFNTPAQPSNAANRAAPLGFADKRLENTRG